MNARAGLPAGRGTGFVAYPRDTSAERTLMASRAEIYRAAMRLIEQHGEAAELAAVLRADTLIRQDERSRQAIIEAIGELRAIGLRSKPS